MRYFEVILGRGAGRIDGALTYAYPEELGPGAIIEAPIGKFTAPGVVVKEVTQPEFKCKEIRRILYSKPLPRHLVAGAKWMAAYYREPLSACLGAMLPVGILKQRRKAKTEQMFGSLTSPDASLGHGVARARLHGARAPAVSAAASDGVLEAQSGLAHISSIQLNPHQKNALEGLQKAPGGTKLLFGVTGSGKTNIYLKMALNVLTAQKSVILLVPEIALTGQLVQVFREVFPDEVVMIHSKQTEAERHRIFDSLLEAEAPKIVIGPRSALLAPLDNLGLIIIDEEHEATYYQENSPKYSAVRLASFMAKELGIDCLLGSATPAIEDFYLAEKKGSLIKLREKAKKSAVKPKIEIIDFKNRDNFSKNRYFCNSLLKSIGDNLENGRQTLIFHNRRGSSPLTICDNCGEEILCPNCFLPLTLHADTYELVCHTCGFTEKVPAGCPKCGHPGLIHKGFGTKLLESEISRLFPKARVARFDADNKKGEGLEAKYTEVRDGEIDILIGTQTVAKGLDLPRLATVGVVAADTGLSLPDFAASEKVFQLLTQVLGRVGRGHQEKAEVFIQTYQPEHPVLKYAISEDYEGFSEYLLRERRKGGFPPYKYIMRLEICLKTEAIVLRKVREAVSKLQSDSRLLVSPPMPAFHERTAKGYTWEIIVRAGSRQALLQACNGLDKNFKVTLDPPSLL